LLEALAEYKGTVEDARNLGRLEHFQMTIGKVVGIEGIIDLLRAHHSLHDEVISIARRICITQTAFEEVFSSKRLKRVTKAVCDIKRIVNKKHIVWVRVSDLVKLKNSTDKNRRSVLDLVVFTALDQKKGDMLLIESDLPSIREASRYNLESLTEEVTAVKRGLKRNQSVLVGKEGQTGVEEMQRFMTEVSIRLCLCLCLCLCGDNL
jgi:hypothetical protein